MARSAGPSKLRTARAQPPPAKRQKTAVSIAPCVFRVEKKKKKKKDADNEFQNQNDPSASRDGVPSCKCGLDAAFATVVKEGPNKGRQFW